MHEKAQFACFIYMQPQNVKFKSVHINMKQVSYIEKDQACVDLLFDTLCPNEGDFLATNVLKASKHEDVTLSTLVEIYNRAETWKLQRQI